MFAILNEACVRQVVLDRQVIPPGLRGGLVQGLGLLGLVGHVLGLHGDLQLVLLGTGLMGT